MKILVISESSSVLHTYSNFFTKSGYDTICYSWLLKALDNVDEIKPHAVLVNAIDYPRHWKTLVQYIRSIPNEIQTIIVVVPTTIEQEEQKKIDALNVCCVEENFIDTDQGRKVLDALAGGMQDTFGQKITEGNELHYDLTVEHDEMIDDEMVIGEDFDNNTIIEISEELTPSDLGEELIVYTDSDDIEEEFESEIIENSNEDDVTSGENEDLYFDDIIDEDNIFEDDEVAEEYTGTWLLCPIKDSNEIIGGGVTNFEHPVLHFSPEDKGAMKFFTFGKKFESCTLWDDGYKTIVSVQVQGLEKDYVELCIVK